MTSRPIGRQSQALNSFGLSTDDVLRGTTGMFGALCDYEATPLGPVVRHGCLRWSFALPRHSIRTLREPPRHLGNLSCAGAL